MGRRVVGIHGLGSVCPWRGDVGARAARLCCLPSRNARFARADQVPLPGPARLTLRGVAAQVVWFEHRPQRHAGHLPAREFAHQWMAFGFRADPPNAALTLLGGRDPADTVVVELVVRPRYDRKRRTMRYVVRLLPKASGKLADFQADLDARVPRGFGAASLLIDTAVARELPSRWLGPGRWRVDLEPSDA